MKILEVSNSTIYFGSIDKILLLMLWIKVMVRCSLFQNLFILRRPGVASFANIIKIAIILIKKTFKVLDLELEREL